MPNFGSQGETLGNRGQTLYSEVMNENVLDELTRRVREVLAQSPAADVEKNMRALIATFLGRLDLVTRDEFDVQRQVLLRTREKLERLEAQIAALERARGPRPDPRG